MEACLSHTGISQVNPQDREGTTTCFNCDYFYHSACYNIIVKKVPDYQKIIFKLLEQLIEDRDKFNTHSHVRLIIFGTDKATEAQMIYDIVEFRKKEFITPKTKTLSARGERTILQLLKSRKGDDAEFQAVYPISEME